MHNPNPFDFVPLPEQPLLYKPAELDTLDRQLTGYIELALKALTPVHIVGALDRTATSSTSRMYQQDGYYCIPASTIRGCLRAFVEAVTSGWVSQATDEYPKKLNERHVGFRTFDEYLNKGRTTTRKSPPAVPHLFKPQTPPKEEDKTNEVKIDLASYLFGVVIEAERGSEPPDDSVARKGKVWIEDAYVDNRNVVTGKYWLPDIAGDAFMGGAKPSASNWWYFQPDEVWNRQMKERSGNTREVAEFVGGKAWGRKFYYHQDPLKCIQYYNGNRGQWRYSQTRPFQRVELSCMEKESTTTTFRVYVNQLPQRFVGLLLLALMPGSTIRHKLGYGKAYGYGSIEFALKSMRLRRENPDERLPGPLRSFEFHLDGWDEVTLTKFGLSPYIDRTALIHLARVLGWTDNEKLLFTYPPFGKGDFMQPIQHGDLRRLLPAHIPVTNSMKVTPDQAREIAAALFPTKRTIHFRYYQEQAKGWNLIVNRKP